MTEARLKQRCHSPLSFFGLPLEYKPVIHEEIFTLCYFAEGGFNFEEVYQMPIYLRRFYLEKLKQIKEKEKKQSEKGSSDGSKLHKPPTYEKR